MEPLTVSSETFQQALCWINGETSSMQEQEVKELIDSLAGGFRSAFRRLHPGSPTPRMRSAVPHPLSLSALAGEEAYQLLQRSRESAKDQAQKTSEAVDKEQETPSPAEPPAADKLDSVTMLNAIAFVSMKSGMAMTQSRAQMILYCIYGSRLGAGKERLGIEHPQMWKYGPVFPRAYKRSSLDDRAACEQAYSELSFTHPEILSRIEAKTSAMMGTPMCDINAVHKGDRSPYGKLLKKNPSKWGLQIPDEDIAQFFKSNRA